MKMATGFRKIPITGAELKFRRKLFADNGELFNLNIECTVCGKLLNGIVAAQKRVEVHRALKVLLCNKCFIACLKSILPNDCAWCGKYYKDHMISCESCPIVFCKHCIIRNFGINELVYATYRRNNYWEKCFFCDPDKLWLLRAVCDASKNFVKDSINGAFEISEGDQLDDCTICLQKFENVKCKDTMTCCNCAEKFCKNCFRRHYGLNGMIEVQLSFWNWKCFDCTFFRCTERRCKLKVEEGVILCSEINSMTLDNNSIRCSICFIRFQTIRQLRCGHEFHEECIKNWTNRNQICPLCRTRSMPIF